MKSLAVIGFEGLMMMSLDLEGLVRSVEGGEVSGMKRLMVSLE